MGLETGAQDGASRFAAYVAAITPALGHADRATPFQSYCAGLLLPGDRKSVEPMAARVQPGRVQAAHQSLHHFVAKADWSDDAMLAAVAEHVLPVIKQRGRIRALMVDDTGMPKQGRHSVGVARQYCGQLGKQDNCQVAVSLSTANDHASLPLAYRLYLPQEWADDPARRARACPTTWPSRPSRRSRLTSWAPPARPGSTLTSCWPTRDTATTPSFATASPISAYPMPSASSPPPPCGGYAIERGLGHFW